MGKFNLSETELEIMQLIWHTNKLLTFREILDYFNDVKKKNWIKQTLRTQMVRLANKGLLNCEKENGRIIYVPAKTENEYMQFWSHGFIDLLFNGSIKNFMLALSGGGELDEETANELRALLEKQV